MPDNSDIIRLTELLISRQDQQQQQTALLLEKIGQTDASVVRHDELLSRQQQQTELLLKKIDRADRIAETFGQVQHKLIDQLELIYNEQQRFNERQERFNERQDQFNIIFLDEIRGLKKDVKMLIEVVMQRHEERLKRLEDFMDGFLRKAS